MVNTNELLHGVSTLTHVVGVEYANGKAELFFERDGNITSRQLDIPLFLLCDKPRAGWLELDGTQPLKYMKTYSTSRQLWEDKRGVSANYLHIYDERESAMMLGGFTLFQQLEPNQVSTLAFDIEATGLERDANAKVILITNAYCQNGMVTHKTFSHDEYPGQAEMLHAWCEWVRNVNPTIITGHNVFSYDLPYLDHVARLHGTKLCLGRNNSPMTFNNWDSKFRRDGSQMYTYRAAHIYGRQIIDTFFLAIKYDVARKYASYGLKNVIKQEGLEAPDRQHYDGASIRHDYTDPAKFAMIRKYAEQDAVDALNLYQLAAPAFFYLSRTIPKTFQSIICTASGSQLNSLMVRSYIQCGHSIPIPTEAEEFEGAISFGNPGVYKNCFKVDVASLYPSIMLEYRVEDRTKDPRGHMLLILEHLTKQRLEYKRLAKETGNKYYQGLDASAKTLINSFFGFLGAPGLNFNSPLCAAQITRTGREVLNKALEWATGGQACVTQKSIK